VVSHPLQFLAVALVPGPAAEVSAWAQTSHAAPAESELRASFDVGAHIQPLRQGYDFPRQTLRYEAEYHFWTAGVATLRIERSGNQEHLAAAADSTGVVALLFRVQDRFNSYFDAQTLCSNKLTSTPKKAHIGAKPRSALTTHAANRSWRRRT